MNVLCQSDFELPLNPPATASSLYDELQGMGAFKNQVDDLVGAYEDTNSVNSNIDDNISSVTLPTASDTTEGDKSSHSCDTADDTRLVTTLQRGLWNGQQNLACKEANPLAKSFYEAEPQYAARYKAPEAKTVEAIDSVDSVQLLKDGVNVVSMAPVVAIPMQPVQVVSQFVAIGSGYYQVVLSQPPAN
eukprot:TRINITY_DN9860_c0_g1_i3.p3 TRINITY_DN9860_c0_g1~~TRINITY_DN9860_c0_g1_i3.p3  ORF type:complete len:189 (+),score=58.81 TRINITY_DN9860_c0_g1_i3:2028-2594(+)